LQFFRDIIVDPDFRAGNLDTGFIDRFLDGRAGSDKSDDDSPLSDLAAVAAALHLASRASTSRELTRTSRWKQMGRR
jgi:hypothetical protein